MWAAVRQLTDREQKTGEIVGITAETLNDHYAAVSTDSNYCAPVRKPMTTNQDHIPYITEFQIFSILDHLQPTATGLDELPAWFLRLGAPAFYEPCSHKAFQSVTCQLYRPSPVETGQYHTSTQNFSTR